MERPQAFDHTAQQRALSLRGGLREAVIFALVAIASAACIFVLAVLLHGPTHAIEPSAFTAPREAAPDTGLPDVMSNRCASEASVASE